MKKFSAIVIVASLGISGCGKLDNETGFFPVGDLSRVNMAGATQIVDMGEDTTPETLEKVNIIRLLDPASITDDTRYKDKNKREYMAIALEAFYKDYSFKNETPKKKNHYPNITREQWRNEVQDRVMMASDSRCNALYIVVRRNDSFWTSTLGGLSILSGGLGAIFTQPAVVRPLAGAASIFSGFEGEFDRAYLAEKTSEAILEGIKIRRDRIRERISERRKGKTNAISVGGGASLSLNLSQADVEALKTPGSTLTLKNKENETSSYTLEPLKTVSLAEYTMTGAIADAIKYHGACQVAAGLQEIGTSLTKTNKQVLQEQLETLKIQAEKWQEINKTFKSSEESNN